MKLSTTCIQRPVMTTLLTISTFFLGLFSYLQMPVSDLPNIEFPTITVSVSYPGASPNTMAATCAVPLEKELMAIDGLQTLFSSNITGSCTLVLQFSLTKSMDSASLDVEAAISRALPNLPDDLAYNPSYKKINPAQTPILYIAITSEALNQQKLYDYGNTFIGQRLNTIEGVSEVVTFGSPYAARIQIDPGAIASRGITMEDVVKTVQTGNVDLPTGSLYGEKKEATIDILGQIEKAEKYNHLVIKTKDNKWTRIGDVGNAFSSLRDDKYSLTYLEKGSSSPCIILAVQTLPGANAVAVTNRIFSALPALQEELPASLRYHTVYNKKSVIMSALFDVEITLLLAFFLVVLIIYLFFGKFISTLIPSISLPISILITFSALYKMGLTLDVFSLLALTLSIGFLVDDAIVVLENTARHVQEGKSPKKAAMLGAKEISATIISMTLSLISVFLPLFFLGGILGRLFLEFAMTVVISVLASGAVSLTLTPLLCSRYIPENFSLERASFVEKISLSFQKWLVGKYEAALLLAFRRKKIFLLLGFLSLLGSFLLLQKIPTDLLPAEDQGFVQGFTQSQDGTSPFLQKRLQEKIAKICIEDPAVKSVVSVTSVQNMINDNQGLFFLQLHPIEKRRSIFSVIKDLTKKTSATAGINAYLSPLPLINLTLGTTTKAVYQFSLTGVDTKQLYEAVETFLQKMKERPELFTEVSSDLQIGQPKTLLSIDRKRASQLAVDTFTIENTFNYAYSNNKISTINTSIDQYDVIVEALPSFSNSEEALSYFFVRSRSGHLVPLNELVSFEKTAGPLAITRINGLPAVTISFNVATGKTLGEALHTLNDFTKELPRSITGRPQGSAAAFGGNSSRFSMLFFLTIFVIYVILGILYESFLHPITVMSSLPPAAFGGLFSLYIFGQSLSIFSFVGLIMLLGIVMKNGIMVVDFAVVNLKEENTIEKAIYDACIVRFRPIIMTTMAALMGALPIALSVGGPSAATRAPLGVAVVGGLLFSQLLTLFLTPIIFYYLETFRRAFKTRFTKD